MGLPGGLVYLAVKAMAYAAWCYAGLSLLSPSQPRRIRRAVTLGLGRLALGVALGLGILLAALSMNNATRNAPLTYVCIYVPVRIFEWGVFHVLISRRYQGLGSLGWILGGVAVSCAADVPILWFEHGVVPVGRPFC